MAIMTIARLTLREASRRRLLLAVAVLTLIIGLLSAWGFHRLLYGSPCGSTGATHPCSPATLKVIASAMLILLGFMFSFVLALGAAFVAAPSVANEIESGIMLSILPRPVRRSDVILGKWLGLCVLLALYAAISCTIEFVIAGLTLNYVPPHPIVAIAFLTGEAIVVLTVTLAASTRVPAITGGVVVSVLFGMAWIAGIVGTVGFTFHNRTVQNVGTVSSLILPTDGLWRGVIYNMEPAAEIVAGSELPEARVNPFFVESPPATPYLVWAALWVAGLLGAAVWSFDRREV